MKVRIPPPFCDSIASARHPHSSTIQSSMAFLPIPKSRKVVRVNLRMTLQFSPAENISPEMKNEKHRNRNSIMRAKRDLLSLKDGFVLKCKLKWEI